MGEVEAKFVEYLQRCVDAGQRSLSSDELHAGVLRDHPQFRNRAAFRHALQRLRVRHVINAINAPDGSSHYLIGSHASPELRASLGHV